ncbi:glyoxalase [Vibrio sp. UCD-FRSSP16_10]|uniref:VOC family protein n=1 Tax=unclassified Vibrio TaxID=2614977 RepID=UPI0007FBB3A3|nr:MULTISPECIES: VOC family protein [unclassified Vibrio]OBT16959.1 glyoxalase [Vibrio sp. UCD-FRSSP16_30]OBT21950.1 glyoxalase [Vibrio sp. UCD-FRSSP16_10]
MFSHVMVGTNNMQASKQFYDALLTTLGYQAGVMDEKGRCFYIADSGVFCLTTPINGEPATSGNGMTIGFRAANSDVVERWHKVGLANGGTECEEPPGIRGNSERQLYMAYLRDPSGNKICTTYFM